jgi:hypothetical protein
MDDDNGEARERSRQEKENRRTPQHKYKLLLQQLADRTIDEITIDLDDVHAVSNAYVPRILPTSIFPSTDLAAVGKPRRGGFTSS